MTEGYDKDHGYSNNKPKYNFIVITKSPIERAENRKFLRDESWLSYNWKDDAGNEISWVHFFLVGLNPSFSRSIIQDENETHKDILLAPTLDVYLGQIYKVMWAQQYLLENYTFNFLVILDEDSILNVNGVNSYLNDLVTDENNVMFYGGSGCIQWPVDRHGKWKVSEEMWRPEVYPIFCDGSGVIYSSETVRELLTVWDENAQPAVGIDDQMIGILIFFSGKIPITTIANATLGCEGGRSDTFLIQQVQPLEEGAQMMQRYNNTGVYCNEDVPRHKQY